MRRLAPVLLLSALLSTGCAATVPRVPASLLACQPRPVPPAPDGDDATLAEFIVALDERGEDCAGRLARVREIVAP